MDPTLRSVDMCGVPRRQCRHGGGARDSAHPEAFLTVGAADWAAFLAGVRAQALEDAAPVAARDRVVKAAREMIRRRDEAYGLNRGDPDWWQGMEWPLILAVDALDKAEEANRG